jgi:hypothetical protein
MLLKKPYISFDQAVTAKGPMLRFARANRDIYDGARSGNAMFGWSRRFPPVVQRADARNGTSNYDPPHRYVFTRKADEEVALATIYFNQGMVQMWNIGRTRRVSDCDLLKRTNGNKVPEKTRAKTAWWRIFSPDESDLEKKAALLAAQATTNP